MSNESVFRICLYQICFGLDNTCSLIEISVPCKSPQCLLAYLYILYRTTINHLNHLNDGMLIMMLLLMKMKLTSRRMVVVVLKKSMRKLVFLSKAAEMLTAAPELGHPAHGTKMKRTGWWLTIITIIAIIFATIVTIIIIIIIATIVIMTF